jgi:hypothetical protein
MGSPETHITAMEPLEGLASARHRHSNRRLN